MASYHLTVKNHSRSKNANAVALASYRSGERLWDERQLLHKDCRKNDKSEVLHSELFNSYRMNREQLWNAAEAAENRKNSVVAREIEIALPVDISDVQKVSLARDFCKELVGRYRCAIDLAVHAPDADGDQRNYHAHILMTTREVGVGGMGAKWRQLNQPNGAGRIEMAELRKNFELLQNRYLENAGVQERVSCGRAADMDIPRKYVALPFKKYQVMRREGRVEEYKEVSGYEEFVRWKSRKELEIEDLAGELELSREQEELERKMDNDIYYYDPVSAQIDAMAVEYEERKKEELRENGRRAIGEFKGLAEINRRADGQAGRENRGLRIDYHQSGEDIARLAGSIEQTAEGVQRISERRSFAKTLAGLAQAIAERFREFGEKVRRFIEGRRRDLEEEKAWQKGAKPVHVAMVKKIVKDLKVIKKRDWLDELKRRSPKEVETSFSWERQCLYESLEKVRVEAPGFFNRKPAILGKIMDLEKELEEVSKDIIPKINKREREVEQENQRKMAEVIERQNRLAREQAVREYEREQEKKALDLKIETMQRAIRFEKMDLLTHDKTVAEVKVNRKAVAEVAQVLNRYVEGRRFLKKIRAGEEVGVTDKLAVWDDIRVESDKGRLDKALAEINYGVKDVLLKEDLIIKRELNNSVKININRGYDRGQDRGQSRGGGISF